MIAISWVIKLILFPPMAVIIKDFIISKIFAIDSEFIKNIFRIHRRPYACIDLTKVRIIAQNRVLFKNLIDLESFQKQLSKSA